MKTRPDWDNYFISIAEVVATRSDCCRKQVGAVLVKDFKVISTGYNGTPKGTQNCCDGGCDRCASSCPSGEEMDKCVCVHAEENAILYAAYHGVATKDSWLYCTHFPCLLCAKSIVSAGISRVIYKNREWNTHYTSRSTYLILGSAKIVVEGGYFSEDEQSK